MPFYVIEKCDSTPHIKQSVFYSSVISNLQQPRQSPKKKKKRKGGKTKEKQENLCYRKFHNLDTGQVLV